jgi:hypothetical protein
MAMANQAHQKIPSTRDCKYRKTPFRRSIDTVQAKFEHCTTHHVLGFRMPFLDLCEK